MDNIQNERNLKYHIKRDLGTMIMSHLLKLFQEKGGKEKHEENLIAGRVMEIMIAY